MMKSFGDMVKHAQKVQKQMAELQEKLKDERFEATAGGGMVKAVVDGRQMLQQLTINPEALKDGATKIITIPATIPITSQRTPPSPSPE